MDPVTMALIVMRGLALAMSTAGRQQEAEQIFKLSDLVAAGRATDEHMRRVADILGERSATSIDLSEIIQSIENERTKLHSDE